MVCSSPKNPCVIFLLDYELNQSASFFTLSNVLWSKLPLFPYHRGWETQPNSRVLYTHYKDSLLKVGGLPSPIQGVDRPWLKCSTHSFCWVPNREADNGSCARCCTTRKVQPWSQEMSHPNSSEGRDSKAISNNNISSHSVLDHILLASYSSI